MSIEQFKLAITSGRIRYDDLRLYFIGKGSIDNANIMSRPRNKRELKMIEARQTRGFFKHRSTYEIDQVVSCIGLDIDEENHNYTDTSHISPCSRPLKIKLIKKTIQKVPIPKDNLKSTKLSDSYKQSRDEVWQYVAQQIIEYILDQEESTDIKSSVVELRDRIHCKADYTTFFKIFPFDYNSQYETKIRMAKHALSYLSSSVKFKEYETADQLSTVKLQIERITEFFKNIIM